MLGGQTMLLFGVATDVMPHVRGGKLRALAVASEKRMPALPDIPTTAEAGVPGVEIEIWLAAFAPKGTPREIVTRLNAEIGRVLEMPEVRERITQDGIGEVKGGTPEQLASLLQSEIAKWSRVVKASGARVD
jgi:tripartite-type tricarboxylate transporter receptor subunit TctC